ncbi:globin domain-containing protein [Staphylococcus carnosus]|uniref:nitric oxide dioxygenase n=1 Tax=Staphylococcus carnosus (strain TM300) TaxID=396513 RepID=B9DQ58_STACT|nr:globin domain-containing protein [Staphylococcus carnosus]QPT03763.1 nitric oxide dioxygenase [Staphylococcus carnosus]UQA66488.1 nitric oxide dioxygenase [Staphylococcus carnosus]UTB78682.1 nitric oxide dioxygenase [Staphylococcus carnosus]UTB88232.1 nitric oxide dioxygenase [Staphylococcus carnosus]UTB90583.1 nitric oxide dioxygenase [Staphylococcus carnosus]
MLTEQEKDIIKQTVPVLQDKGVEITSFFYNRMFNEHPELRNMFNQTNQKKGLQSTALAQTVLAAAANIENLGSIMPVVREIAYKHCALQVPPAGYKIVGDNLIAAIMEVLSLDEEDPIIQAWINAYWEIANVFIDVEKEMYDNMLWDGFQPFKLTNIENVASDIKAFTVSSDEYDLSQFIPGQYITVDVSSEKLPYRAKRHYSIVGGDKDTLTFAVKRDVTKDNEGEVSTILHDEFKVGDDINLTAPVGAFRLHEESKPQLFLGSGIGVTPLVSMFEESVEGDSPSVQFIQNTRDISDVPFAERLANFAAEYDNAEYTLHDREADGYITKEDLEPYVTDDTQIYICGGISFLKSIVNELYELGVDKSRIHFETFIPRLSVEV